MRTRHFFTSCNRYVSKRKKFVGLDINPAYINATKAAIENNKLREKVFLYQSDFFLMDWSNLLGKLPEPILVIGNPPWVTNATLGTLGSSNLPEKSNFQNHLGFDAKTGKSNFDISEWMLIKLLEWLNGRKAFLAMLCKTAVARKVLYHAWKNDICLRSAFMHGIDTDMFFGAAVDACLLVCDLRTGRHNYDCDIYQCLGDTEEKTVIGYRDGRVLSDTTTYEQLKHLRGQEFYKWRSGIKHDSSPVMEFTKEGNYFLNGLGEVIELEDDFVYPMLKSSEIANGLIIKPSRWMLVTQRSVGEDTSIIKHKAPKTWKYLLTHADRLDKRASSIYHKRPQFSIFGVGDYSFTQYKVAISGFYKRLGFKLVGSYKHKPIVLDDTINFIACNSKQEGELLLSMLNSDIAKEFYSSYIFWDAKRPVTIEILRQLDLMKLAKQLGKEDEFSRFVKTNKNLNKQCSLFAV